MREVEIGGGDSLLFGFGVPLLVLMEESMSGDDGLDLSFRKDDRSIREIHRDVGIPLEGDSDQVSAVLQPHFVRGGGRRQVEKRWHDEDIRCESVKIAEGCLHKGISYYLKLSNPRAKGPRIPEELQIWGKGVNSRTFPHGSTLWCVGRQQSSTKRFDRVVVGVVEKTLSERLETEADWWRQARPVCRPDEQMSPLCLLPKNLLV